jgi:hypothetical protein
MHYFFRLLYQASTLKLHYMSMALVSRHMLCEEVVKALSMFSLPTQLSIALNAPIAQCTTCTAFTCLILIPRGKGE